MSEQNECVKILMRYVKLISLLFFANTAISQDSIMVKRWSFNSVREVLASHNTFYIDTALNKYAGHWIAEVGDTIFDLTLHKLTSNLKTDDDPVLCQTLEGRLSIHSITSPKENLPDITLNAGFQNCQKHLMLTGDIHPTVSSCIMCPEYIKYDVVLDSTCLAITWVNNREEGFYRRSPSYLPMVILFRPWTFPEMRRKNFNLKHIE